MAIHHITSEYGSFSHPAAPGLPAEPGLLAAIDATPEGDPIVLMVHGYRYTPHTPKSDPHATLYAPDDPRDNWKVASWPVGIGMQGQRGLAIGYGWDAGERYTNPRRDLTDLYARAGREGAALARLIRLIATHAPDRQIDLMAHSMGARVALSAIAALDQPTIRRVILLGGTEFEGAVSTALASQAGRFAEFFNITAHQNRFYDFLFRLSGPKAHMTDRLLGGGLSKPPANWMDICIDAPRTERTLDDFGIALAPAEPCFCHWSFYIRGGVFDLYRQIIDAHPITLAAFRRALSGAQYDGAYRGITGTLRQTAASLVHSRVASSSSSRP